MTARITIAVWLCCLYAGCFAQEIDNKGIPLTISKPDRYIVFPMLVKSPEYKWGAGAAGIYYFRLKTDSTSRTSNVKLVSFVTVRKQIVLASEGNIFFKGEDFILHFVASASHFPDKFWGLGNNTPSSAVENYTISQFDIYPQLLKKIRPNLFAGISYEFQDVYNFDYDSRNGESLFDRENILGRYGSKISGTGVMFCWDSRNNAFGSSGGFYIQYFINAYRDFLGSDYNFNVQNLDVRKYFSMQHSRVLAFQFNLISASGDIPIRDYSVMGTNMYMRGYYEGRYQDKNMIAFQSELRTPVYKRWGAVIFSGVGKVGRNFSEVFNWQQIKPSIGIGLRFALNPKENLNLRVDAGFGKHSQGTYINLGEAF
ncbi:BamA/TamA family outer membrane protein [Ohtaekwangia sp.]|uniref:BamA/TamA family outer membrane protein n=1 Tax=Ohtaekwangia sp. TaxID=2066019 RepID=UPI002F92302F